MSEGSPERIRPINKNPLTSHLIAVLIAAMLVICLPAPALAHSAAQLFAVVPAEVSIDDLPPGQATEFELTICNQDEAAHNFTLATFSPREEDRREGRAEFPDHTWISFFPQQIEVAANSEATVNVTVAVPPEREWSDKGWEIWLGVETESDDLLVTKLYARLLVSTSAEQADRSDGARVVGIAVAAIALGYGARFCWRRRAALK
jgi:hypothetical protein